LMEIAFRLNEQGSGVTRFGKLSARWLINSVQPAARGVRLHFAAPATEAVAFKQLAAARRAGFDRHGHGVMLVDGCFCACHNFSTTRTALGNCKAGAIELVLKKLGKSAKNADGLVER